MFSGIMSEMFQLLRFVVVSFVKGATFALPRLFKLLAWLFTDAKRTAISIAVIILLWISCGPRSVGVALNALFAAGTGFLIVIGILFLITNVFDIKIPVIGGKKKKRRKP